MSTQQRDRVDISWVQVFGSALAAVTSAVLLSTVGVAGTIIGAAIGSVFATAGSAIYAHYLRITRARVAAAQAAAAERVSRARSGASGVWAESRRADDGRGRTTTLRSDRARAELEDAEQDLDEAGEQDKPSWREAAAGLPWKRIGVLAGGVFLVAMLVIVSFELATGRPVSQYTGGSSDTGARTSIPGLGGSRGRSTPTPAPTGTPTTGGSASSPSSGPSATSTPSTAPSGTPSTAPTTSAPSATPTTAAPTTGAPSHAPTATPSPGQTPTG